MIRVINVTSCNTTNKLKLGKSIVSQGKVKENENYSHPVSPFIQIVDKVIMLSYIFYAQKHCSVMYYHEEITCPSVLQPYFLQRKYENIK